MFKLNRKAFTLEEMQAVIFIIFILMVVGAVSWRAADRRARLDFAAQRLLSVVKQAQNETLNKTMADSELPNGYGVYVSATEKKYLFYADLSGSTDDYKYDANDNIVSQYDFGDNISIVFSEQDVFFKMPKGEVYFNGAALIAAKTITVTQTQTNQSKTITINPVSGLVDIN